MKVCLSALLLVIALPASAQAPAAPMRPVATVSSGLPHIVLETSAGRIVIELETVKAPISATNFLKYVDQKKLDGTEFYRAVKAADHFGFVQFGANGEPRRLLPPIAHEPTTQTGLHHVDGEISLARLAPGTGRSEFTISVGDQTHSLDAGQGQPADNLGYAAFGRVVEGMNVVVGIMDAPVSSTATQHGAFKGEVPVATVKILTARRAKS